MLVLGAVLLSIVALLICLFSPPLGLAFGILSMIMSVQGIKTSENIAVKIVLRIALAGSLIAMALPFILYVLIATGVVVVD